MPAPPDAAEVRPWHPGMGPEPRVTCYPPGARPLLRIHTAGAWRLAKVRARHDWPNGRISVQVEIALPVDRGARCTVHYRTYWWDRRVMRAVAPSP